MLDTELKDLILTLIGFNLALMSFLLSIQPLPFVMEMFSVYHSILDVCKQSLNEKGMI
jgi:hypothetical protein